MMSQETQSNELLAGISQNPEGYVQGPMANRVLSRHVYAPVSNLNSWLPGGVIPYKFYLNMVKNAANYHGVMSTVNPAFSRNCCTPVATGSFQLPGTDVGEDKEGPTELRSDGYPLIKLNPSTVSPRRFVDFATNLARSANCVLTNSFLSRQRTEAEKQTLEALASLLSANNAFGIYSESPFLRPVSLLRPVQFASPATVLLNHSDHENMIRVQSNSLVRGRTIDIDLTWLHAPLEDHAMPLLEMVCSGSCTPILNHLLNLPLIQVSLDRVQPIPEFVQMFSSAVVGRPVTDPPSGCKPPHLPPETPEALVGVYDFCRSPDRVIAASETLVSLLPNYLFL
ncbi:unnamed protein product [Dibothriocephalus latus]|uniref:Uncharacterized protein n=1 Tax=Dibothriocephalus latus TaxID=60516 RepID=A0A3P7LB68_DIBLA|nr:unnamed protein product [Dibothriocephalus latus]